MSTNKATAIYCGNRKGDLIKILIPFSEKKKPNETPAAFRKRVGVYSVVREA